MEGILEIKAGDRSAQGVLLLLALLEGAERPPQKVEVLVADRGSSIRPAAAVFAVEGKGAVGLIGVADVEFVLNPLAAEGELMFPVNPGHVVLDGQGIVVEMGDRIGSSADGEFAFGDLQPIGDCLVHAYAQRAGVDVVRRVTAIVNAAHHRSVRLVDEIRCERSDQAENERLGTFDIS